VLKPNDKHPVMVKEMKKKTRQERNNISIKAILLQLASLIKDLFRISHKLKESGLNLSVNASSTKGLCLPVPGLSISCGVNVQVQMNTTTEKVMALYDQVEPILWPKKPKKESASAKAKTKIKDANEKLKEGLKGMSNRMNSFFKKKKPAK